MQHKHIYGYPIHITVMLAWVILCLCNGPAYSENKPKIHPPNNEGSDHLEEKQAAVHHIDDYATDRIEKDEHITAVPTDPNQYASAQQQIHPQVLRQAVKDSKFHHTKAAELIDKKQGLEHSEPWQIVMRQAELAARSKDYDMAEGLYGHAFLLGPPEEAHKKGYLELAKMYEESDELSKMAAVYEKFTLRFKNDPRLAQIYMRLGHLYREMGAYKMAISRFYNVLNVTLKIDASGIDSYKEISLQAQRDIADTYFIMGNFEEAEKFYKRLLFLNLDSNDKMHVLYKTNYLDYLQKEYSACAAGLEEFLKLYPHSRFAPESHFMLANAFNELNQPREAVRQVLKLLKKRANIAPEDMELWQYWRKKTANRLAEQFYKHGDFLSAIKIYQAMAPLSRNPSWQWPVIYRIGLCFERLYMYPKAQEAYSLIASGKEWEDINFTMSPTLTSLKDMASWRLEHLEWSTSTKTRMKEILEIAEQQAAVTRMLNEESGDTAPTVHN